MQINAITCTCLLFISGCSSAIHKVAEVDGVDTLSIDAKQRLVFVNEAGGPQHDRRIVCAEPGPDALVAHAAALSGQASATQSQQVGLAGSTNEAAGSIGLRTQTIQILRDGYYRLCEAYMNGAIDNETYQKAISNVDGVIAVVLAIDSLGAGPTAAAVVLASGGATANTNTDETAANITPATNEIKNINIDRTNLSSAQAKAIESIIREYLAHRRKLIARTR